MNDPARVHELLAPLRREAGEPGSVSFPIDVQLVVEFYSQKL